jgi:hypothetical protein
MATRPAIVIGVGGTGSWVLSWLKKDLVETYENLDNIPVKLLLLDTAELLAEVGHAGNQARDVARGQYSKYLILDDDEFIQLPTDNNAATTNKIRASVLNNQIDYLDWLSGGPRFPLPAWDLTDGAGQFRQLGRMALLKGLYLNQHNDPVYSRLQLMVNELTNKAGAGDPSIDVHITGSFIGGSGSGLFLDVAWLLRKIIPAHVKVFISGFFVLPGALNANPTHPQRAKAFSAWRELNRMMTIERNVSEFRLQWGPNASAIYNVESPAYDHVYLIDSMPPGGRDATESVFPVIADAISFLMDTGSGNEYIQHMRANFPPVKVSAAFRGKPTYSTLFVHSWKLPVYHRLNVARHEFAIEYLERLLDVQKSSVAGIGTNSTSEKYALTSKPQYRNKAVELFQADLIGAGLTQFIQLQAEVNQIPAVLVSNKVQEYASFAKDLLDIYTIMPDTDEGRFVAEELKEYVEFVIPQLPDTNSNADLNNFVLNGQQKLYGSKGAGGLYAIIFGDFIENRLQGRLYDKLSQQVDKFHLQVFRERLQTWIRTQLNTPSDGQFSGLACVKDALNQLITYLSDSINFFTQVRTSLPSIQSLQSDADTALNAALMATANDSIVESLKNKAGLPGSGKAATRTWVQIEAELLHFQRSARAIDAMINTLTNLLNYTKDRALNQILMMESYLVTGNSATGIPGLYQELKNSLEDEKQRHNKDTNLKVVTQMLGDNRDVPPPDKTEVEALVQATSWQIDDNLVLKLQIQVVPVPQPRIVTIEADLRSPNAIRKLVNTVINDVAKYRVRDTVQKKAISQVTTDRLTKDITDFTETTLFVPNPLKPADNQVRTFYLRCDPDGRENELEALMAGVSLPRNTPNRVAHVGSSNPHKIVLFSARELLLPENFAEWTNSMDSYQLLVAGDPMQTILPDLDRIRDDHLFKSEQNALWLENRFRQEDPRGRFPVLNQRLVHLLENKDRLDDFLRMWTFGWVNDRQGDRRELIWSIHYIDGDGSERSIKELVNKADIDMIAVMARYVIYGRDRNNQELPFKAIEKCSESFYDQYKYDRKKSKELLEIFRFEAEMSRTVFRVITQRLEVQTPPAGIRKALDAATTTVTRPTSYNILSTPEQQADEGEETETRQRYRRTLAEEIAYDFTRSRQGEPLVTNQEAHLQMLEILLYHLYTVLADEIKEARENQGWN